MTMQTSMKNVHAPARILMAILFLVSGMGKLSDVEGTQKYMEGKSSSLLMQNAMKSQIPN